MGFVTNVSKYSIDDIQIQINYLTDILYISMHTLLEYEYWIIFTLYCFAD